MNATLRSSVLTVLFRSEELLLSCITSRKAGKESEFTVLRIWRDPFMRLEQNSDTKAGNNIASDRIRKEANNLHCLNNAAIKSEAPYRTVQEPLFSGILRRGDGRFINPLPLPQLRLLHPLHIISTPKSQSKHTKTLDHTNPLVRWHHRRYGSTHQRQLASGRSIRHARAAVSSSDRRRAQAHTHTHT
jgi:hypothetical protein